MLLGPRNRCYIGLYFDELIWLSSNIIFLGLVKFNSLGVIWLFILTLSIFLNIFLRNLVDANLLIGLIYDSRHPSLYNLVLVRLLLYLLLLGSIHVHNVLVDLLVRRQVRVSRIMLDVIIVYQLLVNSHDLLLLLCLLL